MRKVFLDELPQKEGIGSLKRKMVIDWKNSVGYKVSFIYDDIEGEVEIIKYEKSDVKLSIKYNDKEFDIAINSFKTCNLGKVIGKRTKEFKVEIGQVFKDDKRDIIITDKEYRNRIHSNNSSLINEKYYKYTCNKCGWTEGWIIERTLMRGGTCACCNGRIFVPEINSIYVKAPWMMKWISEEDAKRYTPQSNKKVRIKCSDCGKEKNIGIHRIYKKNDIGCICGDGFSYPEKFVANILKQLDIEFQTQLSKTTFDWCKDKRYDFYIPSLNMIIETHGLQHYKQAKGFYKSLQEEQENDKLKEQLARENGIKNYIILDCRNSDLEWIKNSVLNSQLSKLLRVDKVDWKKCEESALSNLVKEVCDYWNNKEEWETTQTIADKNKWGIKSKQCIISYLKKGTKLGWTNYDPKEENNQNAKKICGWNKKSIEVFKGNKSLGIFESTMQLERLGEEILGVKLLSSGVSAVCRGESDFYKGFAFKYIENNEQIAS